MNEQLQQALTELITKATTGIDSASEFILAEMPEVIQQLLMWHGIRSLILFMFGVLLTIIVVYANYRQIKWIKGKDVFDEPFLVLNLFQSLLIIPFAATFNLTWLQIWIAPKVWLIEYAANLVK